MLQRPDREFACGDSTFCTTKGQGETYSTSHYLSGMPARTDSLPELPSPRERLQWVRERAGFKEATEAAKRFNWNPNTYRSHENGTRDLSKKAAARYASGFKVPPGWLLYGDAKQPSPVDIFVSYSGKDGDRLLAIETKVDQVFDRVDQLLRSIEELLAKRAPPEKIKRQSKG